jgi:hypothetical protein
VFEGHELGHVHANPSTLDLPLPADRTNWLTKQLASRADAEDGVALLRESYDALHAPLASSERSQS